MARFSVSIESTGNTTAELYGTFSGGDNSYSYQRYIRVSIDGYGSFDVYSDETSGGENTFTDSITDLSPGTTYSWTATLYVRVPGGWDATSYTDSGAFTTQGGEASNAYIYLGKWYNAIPYVYVGSWQPASGKIYLDDWR